MKKSILIICMFFLGFYLFSCNYFDKNGSSKKSRKTKEETERENILKIGREIAFKEYGDIIKNELPLHAKLVGDSVWIVEGTLPKGSVGGTVYIEIRSSDNKVLKVTHYK